MGCHRFFRGFPSHPSGFSGEADIDKAKSPMVNFKPDCGISGRRRMAVTGNRELHRCLRWGKRLVGERSGADEVPSHLIAVHTAERSSFPE